MFVDFGMAKQYDGVCYLRYDDTNPEAEKLEYIEHIEVRAGVVYHSTSPQAQVHCAH